MSLICTLCIEVVDFAVNMSGSRLKLYYIVTFLEITIYSYRVLPNISGSAIFDRNNGFRKQYKLALLEKTR